MSWDANIASHPHLGLGGGHPYSGPRLAPQQPAHQATTGRDASAIKTLDPCFWTIETRKPYIIE